MQSIPETRVGLSADVLADEGGQLVGVKADGRNADGACPVEIHVSELVS